MTHVIQAVCYSDNSWTFSYTHICWIPGCQSVWSIKTS